MEKAILKTLAYSDIFDYPLKAYEIHKWLIGKKASLKQVERALKKLSQESNRRKRASLKAGVKNQGDYYFLKGRQKIVKKRLVKEKYSQKLLRKAKLVSRVIKLIPFIKLIGISGGLALNNATQKDDIDLFIITKKQRLWISRLFILVILEALRVRRKRGDSQVKAAGKVCINIILEEDRLAQMNNNIYLAHEVLQMKVLWQKDGIYQKYLEDNAWAIKFLPNWISANSSMYHVLSIKVKNTSSHNTYYLILTTIFSFFNNLAKSYQLKRMGAPKGMERIQEGAVYFLPNDYSQFVLNKYLKRISRL